MRSIHQIGPCERSGYSGGEGPNAPVAQRRRDDERGREQDGDPRGEVPDANRGFVAREERQRWHKYRQPAQSDQNSA